MKQNLNELAARIHKQNAQWWSDLVTGKPIERNKGELLMLVITELSEATDGIRKTLMDDHLPSRLMDEVEMADALIRLLDYAHGFNLGNLSVSTFGMDGLMPENKAEAILLITKQVTKIYDEANSTREASMLVGALSMIEYYCEFHSLDLEGAMEEKVLYNQTRADHKREARLLADGKKF